MSNFNFLHFNNPWDFELLDSGNGFRLERWGKHILKRPDPQAIWQPSLRAKEWEKTDAWFTYDWHTKPGFKKEFIISWQDIQLQGKLAPFKHTGIFAEQSAHWEQFSRKSAVGSRKLKILNLFAYTGAATIVLTKLGHFVTHVDASKPAIAWAKENQKLNNLPDNSIRWILDDAVKFVKRELARKQSYDAVLLDPPAFGRSPNGKVWKFAEDFPGLLANCVSLLSQSPTFILVNAYATNTSAIALQNILEDALRNKKCRIDSGELCLKQKNKRLLSTGIYSKATF
ncbi:MAG TPA: class I SAM-dependent methyltransferase [Patescibacteria group bacterium]|nr:class I SAM-dependent methyltransferase [Patescibacteria group bacterium]